MIDPTQLRALMQATLDAWKAPRNSGAVLNSPAAVALLMGTAAVESGCGRYLYQLEDGPARGIFQCEPATERDCWKNWLSPRPLWRQAFTKVCGVLEPSPLALTGNLLYQILLARLHYWRVAAPLPAADDIPAQAAYWKQFYNTPAGQGTVRDYLYAQHLLRF